MDYIGAADFYLWQGIAKGLGQPINNVDKILAGLPIFGNNDVSKACYEAYGYGYILGTQLTEEEYLELTSYPKEDIIVNTVITKEDDEKEYIESGVKTKLTGNC